MVEPGTAPIIAVHTGEKSLKEPAHHPNRAKSTVAPGVIKRYGAPSFAALAAALCRKAL